MTATVVEPSEPVTISEPAVTVVGPVYVFTPASVSVPPPTVSPSVPVPVVLSLKTVAVVPPPLIVRMLVPLPLLRIVPVLL